MFKFLCKAAGMVAVTALILRLGEAVSNRVCGKQHSIKIIGRPKEAGSHWYHRRRRRPNRYFYQRPGESPGGFQCVQQARRRGESPLE